MAEPLMLDNRTGILHRCGEVNMATACGLELDAFTVGPGAPLRVWSVGECPECFRD